MYIYIYIYIYIYMDTPWFILYIYIYIYTYISPAAPQGHTAVRPCCSVLVSLLSRHPTISLFFWSPALFSLFSGSVFSVLSGLIEGCWGHGRVKISVKKMVALNQPDLPDYLSSLETYLKDTRIHFLIRSGWPELPLKFLPPYINAHPPGVGIFQRSSGPPDVIS